MIKRFTLLTALFAACLAADVRPIDVSYTISGSAGAWDLNFTVGNQLTAWPAQNLYEFGVKLSVPGITGSPAGYDPSVPPLTNFFIGGAPITYNNIWADFLNTQLLPGGSLSGFRVHVPDTAAPLSVPWFAYTYDASYQSMYDGADAFATGFDGISSGFEGVAAGDPVSAVPEPSPVVLLFVGGATGVLLRRRY